VWDPPDQLAASSIRVGLMGAGVMGQASGRALRHLGFHVTGWARSARAGSAFPIHAGRDALGAFLEELDILVNILPRTDETTGLVDKAVFARLGRLRPGPKYFINAGRGDTVVQNDLIEALKTGVLQGAVLDVFTPEPLPADNPLWAMDNVLITPHVAADSNPLTIIPQVFKDVASLERGERPAGVVDLMRGY
jgi:glyoxylate/hydroxypyruvate reductase A